MKLRDIFLLCLFCFFLTGCASVQLPSIGSFGNPSSPAPSAPKETLGKRPEEDLAENNNAAPKTENTPPPDNKKSEKVSGAAQAEADKGKDISPTSNAKCENNGKVGDTCDPPNWLNVAMSFYDIYEGDVNQKGKSGYNVDGESENVLMFHKKANFTSIAKAHGYKTYTKSAAWCGSFVNWCLVNTRNPKTEGKNYPTIANAFRASSWEKYGEKSEPCLGAIMVIQGSSGKHVTFIVGQRQIVKKEKKIIEFLCLGGNQDDHVNLTYYGKRHKIMAIRIPEGYKPCKNDYNLEDTWYTKYYESQNIKNGSGSTT